MITGLKQIPVLLVFLVFKLCLLGCGKEVENQSGASAPDRTKPEQTAMDAYLARQEVVCEQDQACPSYMAKIVVVDGSKFRFCSGFLTEDDVIATSASCLTEFLRNTGADCRQDVFFFFPQAASRPAERAGCDQVILSSSNQVQNPALWHHDVAYLKLSSPVRFRRTALISREGILNRGKYTTWMIDQEDESFAVLKKLNCEGVHNSYINPLATNESSPNMMVADCLTTRGGTGAPLLDGVKVRGIISRSMDLALRTELLKTDLLQNGLKEMAHVTNFACAPMPDDTEVRDQAECGKELAPFELDRLRTEMISSNIVFSNFRKKYEETLNGRSKFVNFAVNLIPRGNIQETEIYPKCFKPLLGWLPTLSSNRNNYEDNLLLPSVSFRRTMDPYGKVQVISVPGADKDTFIQFSLKNLRSVQKSDVVMWYKGQAQKMYPSLTEVCSPSLF
jgi:hypothetical protein